MTVTLLRLQSRSPPGAEAGDNFNNVMAALATSRCLATNSTIMDNFNPSMDK